MSKLEKLVTEDKAIRNARARLVKRERKLTNALKQYRGDVIQIEDEVYCVTKQEYPSITYVGELT
jgi:hypothetical protein